MKERIVAFYNNHEDKIKATGTGILTGIAGMGLLSTVILLKFASALDKTADKGCGNCKK